MPVGRITPSKGEGTLCGVIVETVPGTGLARRAEPLILGGSLAEQRPG